MESREFLLNNNCIFLKQDISRSAISQGHSKLCLRTDSAMSTNSKIYVFALVLNEFYVFFLRSRGGVGRGRKAEMWSFIRGRATLLFYRCASLVG